MRIIDERTATVGNTVSTAEEALLALGADTEERLALGLRHVWYFVHPDDAAAGDDDADDDRERRTVRSVAEARPGVLGAALSTKSERRAERWATWDLRFDAFTEANVMDWPRTVGELRGEAALAEAIDRRVGGAPQRRLARRLGGAAAGLRRLRVTRARPRRAPPPRPPRRCGTASGATATCTSST